MNRALLADYLDSLAQYGIPGCECSVVYNHEIIFRHKSGYSDHAMKKPLTGSNTYWIFSATKLITCTAVMRLIDKKLIALDAPVSDYLPEYKNMMVKTGSGPVPCRITPTIRHLLSMQSGLNYNLGSPSLLKILKADGDKATTRQLIRALANEPLDFEPGTHFQYSLSHDVLGAVIEVVSGQSLGEYFDEHIFKPLGMKDTGFKLTPERKARMCDLFEFDVDSKTSLPVSSENCYALSGNYESGGAGLISTADDYILFLDAMCHGGISADGYRLVSMESIDNMRQDQLSESSKKDFDLWGRIGYSYGLGVRTLVEKEKSGARSPLGEFGWDGAAGAYAFIDPENHLAVFYAQHVRKCGFVYHDIHPKIRDLTYEMIGL